MGNICDQLTDKRILVTGGAGFIGSEVVHQLALCGARVTVLDNLSSGRAEYVSGLPSVNLIKGDVCDKEVVSKVVKDAEIVIHLAALPFIPDAYYFPEEFFTTNVSGTMNLILKSLNSKTVERLIHISSSEVYGTAKYVPMDEEHPTLPHSTYAVSKLAADRLAYTIHKEHDFPIVIIRPFNSYGPRITQPYIIPEIVGQLLNGNSHLFLGNTESSRDFTFVSDTARGIIMSIVASNIEGHTINLGCGRAIKISDLASTIARIVGKTIEITRDETRYRPFDVNTLICNNRKAQEVLGWKPYVSLEEGLTLTIGWIAKNQIKFETPFKGWPSVYRSKYS